MSKRDEFPAPTIKALQKRAAFICSNPDCSVLTIAPSNDNETECLYIGRAAHITAASEGGPRYDASLTPEQRKGISNAIFLCASCADMVDDNGGADYRADVLRTWKGGHESWVRNNLNKTRATITEVAGTHEAQGTGDVAGLRIIGRPVTIKPGTIARAKGAGRVSGTVIE